MANDFHVRMYHTYDPNFGIPVDGFETRSLPVHTLPHLEEIINWCFVTYGDPGEIPKAGWGHLFKQIDNRLMKLENGKLIVDEVYGNYMTYEVLIMIRPDLASAFKLRWGDMIEEKKV